MAYLMFHLTPNQNLVKHKVLASIDRPCLWHGFFFTILSTCSRNAGEILRAGKGIGDGAGKGIGDGELNSNSSWCITYTVPVLAAATLNHARNFFQNPHNLISG